MPDGHADGRALQAKYAADLVLQIPLIGEMEQPGIVAEADKVGGLDAGLGHIVDLQPPAPVRRRLNPGLGVGQNAIEHTGGDAGAGLVVDILDVGNESNLMVEISSRMKRVTST